MAGVRGASRARAKERLLAVHLFLDSRIDTKHEKAYYKSELFLKARLLYHAVSEHTF